MREVQPRPEVANRDPGDLSQMEHARADKVEAAQEISTRIDHVKSSQRLTPDERVLVYGQILKEHHRNFSLSNTIEMILAVAPDFPQSTHLAAGEVEKVARGLSLLLSRRFGSSELGLERLKALSLSKDEAIGVLNFVVLSGDASERNARVIENYTSGRLNELTSAEVLTVAEAFAQLHATFSKLDSMPLIAVARRARRFVLELSPNDQVRLLSAFDDRRGFEVDSLFDSVLGKLSGSDGYFEMSPSALVKLSRACARQNVRKSEALDKISEQVRLCPEYFNAGQTIQIAYNSAVLNRVSIDILENAAEKLDAALTESPRTIKSANLAKFVWTAALMNREDLTKSAWEEIGRRNPYSFSGHLLRLLLEASVVSDVLMPEALVFRMHKDRDIPAQKANGFERKVEAVLASIQDDYAAKGERFHYEPQAILLGSPSDFYIEIGPEDEALRFPLECDGERFHYQNRKFGDRLRGTDEMRDRTLEKLEFTPIRVADVEFDPPLDEKVGRGNHRRDWSEKVTPEEFEYQRQLILSRLKGDN